MYIKKKHVEKTYTKKNSLSDKCITKTDLHHILPEKPFGQKEFLGIPPKNKHVSACRTMVSETTYYRAWRRPSAGFTGPLNPRSSVLGSAPAFFSFSCRTIGNCLAHWYKISRMPIFNFPKKMGFWVEYIPFFGNRVEYSLLRPLVYRL